MSGDSAAAPAVREPSSPPSVGTITRAGTAGEPRGQEVTPRYRTAVIRMQQRRIERQTFGNFAEETHGRGTYWTVRAALPSTAAHAALVMVVVVAPFCASVLMRPLSSMPTSDDVGCVPSPVPTMCSTSGSIRRLRLPGTAGLPPVPRPKYVAADADTFSPGKNAPRLAASSTMAEQY